MPRKPQMLSGPGWIIWGTRVLPVAATRWANSRNCGTRSSESRQVVLPYVLVLAVNRDGVYHDIAGAALGAADEDVREALGHGAVLRLVVHAHGGHADAVAQRQGAHLERGKQLRVFHVHGVSCPLKSFYSSGAPPAGHFSGMASKHLLIHDGASGYAAVEERAAYGGAAGGGTCVPYIPVPATSPAAYRRGITLRRGVLRAPRGRCPARRR